MSVHPLIFTLQEHWGGSSIQYGNTFVIVGGDERNGTDQYKSSVIKFDTDTRSWMDLPQVLATGRSEFAAFLVPDWFVRCS